MQIATDHDTEDPQPGPQPSPWLTLHEAAQRLAPGRGSSYVRFIMVTCEPCALAAGANFASWLCGLTTGCSAQPDVPSKAR